MEYLRYEPYSFVEEEHSFFEEKYSSALVYKGEKIGHLGLLKKRILDFYSLKRPVYAAEISLAALFENSQNPFNACPW